MKKSSVLFTILIFLFVQVSAQNPYQYETKVISLIQGTASGFGGGSIMATAVRPGGFVPSGGSLASAVTGYSLTGGRPSVHGKNIQELLQYVLTSMNNAGYSLKAVVSNKATEVDLFFEKSSSYREQELYKLVSELTQRIDTVSKKYTDSAMLVIQQNVLNYLQAIPNEVITAAYKETLSKQIILEAEDKIKAAIELMKAEIRQSTTNP